MRFTLIILILTIFCSCDSESTSINEFDPDCIVIIDTATIKASTVLLDQVVTSGERLSVGRYKDPYLGDVTAKAFAKVDLGSCLRLNFNYNSGSFRYTKYDSLVFIANYTEQGDFYGDTLKKQVISVHELKEELELDDFTFNFCNNSELEYDPTPLGKAQFFARPKARAYNGEKLSIRIPLSDGLGENLIKMLNESSDTLIDSFKWSEYFRGVVLNCDSENTAAILKFPVGETFMKMRLYYHEIEGENSHELKYHDFPVRSSIFNFTNYSADRSKTVLADLKDQKDDIKSIDTDDLTFIQCGTGLATKIEIPYWDQMLIRLDIGDLLKVELELYPLNLSYRKHAMPHSLNVFATNNRNEIDYYPFLLEKRKGDRFAKPLEAQFYYDDDTYINSHYKIDLTTYLKPKLYDFETENIQLMIMPNAKLIGEFVERIVFTNEKKSDYRFKLKTTFKKK